MSVSAPAAPGGVLLGAKTTPDEAARRLLVIDAALSCIGTSGVSGTTVEAIASRAGLGRATLYRTFAGGRDEILGAVLETEAMRFFASMSVELARAETLEDLCVALVVGGVSRLRGSAALGALLVEAPELVLGRLAFEGMDQTLALMSDFTWPFFGRFMAEDAARRSGELVVRVAISYLVSPEAGVELSDEDCVRGLLARHVLPGVAALAA